MKTADQQALDGVLEHAFGKLGEVKLSDGKTYMVKKWSVGKFAKLGKSISKIVASVLSIVTNNLREEYKQAEAEAVAQGLGPGDEGWPDPNAYGAMTLTDMAAAVPGVLETCTSELCLIVGQSLSLGDKREVDEGYILDKFDLDDLADAMRVIVEVNNLVESGKKWMGLFQKMTRR